ncbi:D-glucuronyl C5-epimerase family protein [Anabaena sp. CCY 9402-a]|uniref:D-glucuronyl C5-epimerase family protein n=1 Tax=Anabaena sp. CCY 9402-a TaxID=3103867 RepID=UPI0039C66FD8
MKKRKIKNNQKLFLGIFIVALISCLLFALPQKNQLGLQSFYGSSNFYDNIWESNKRKLFKNNNLNENTDLIKVDSLVEPYMGWKTEGKPAPNPTKVAANGLYAILNKNIIVAKAHAQWLQEHSVNNDQALFFPFQFDFEPYYPFVVKAPWNSCLTQGLALGLFTYLYQETRQREYLDTANQIYNSYLVPIEKGGFTLFEKEGLFFEEYPTKTPTRVLNGAAVAMLALNDYALITNNYQASQMFKSSIKRLEAIIPEYETKDPTTGIISSFYSLGIPRSEILGRFVGEGNFLLDKIKLIGTKNKQETVISTVDVGSNQDASVAENFYVYIDQKFMNWGELQQKQNYYFREVNSNQGAYNHSPFKFVFNSETNFDNYAIEITYKPIDKYIDRQISLQLFDQIEYWKLGKITHQDNKIASNIWKTERFNISSQFIQSWSSNKNDKPLIDDKYLDDNQILVKLLGTLSDSKILLNYAERWQESNLLVPAQFFNNFPPPILINQKKEPVLATINGGQESRFTEYPSVIKIGEEYLMFYSAYGEDEKWRIFLSSSNDGNNFVRRGLVFDDQELPQDCQGNRAFPFVVKNPKNDTYFMYFSCASKPKQPYDKIILASSLDGFSWEYKGVIVKEGGLDPFVVIQNDQYRMFYSIVENGYVKIKELISRDGVRFTNNQIVLQSSDIRSFYTIGGLLFDAKLCLFLESNVIPSQRHETVLYCEQGKNSFHPTTNNPIIIDKDWENNWDNIKYGFDLFQDGNKVFVYYNGISKLNAESDAHIGKAELDIYKLKDYSSKLKLD